MVKGTNYRSWRYDEHLPSLEVFLIVSLSWHGPRGLGGLAAIGTQAVQGRQPCFLPTPHPCLAVAVPGSRCWVLTLWSSSALVFGCCSWQGGKGSEPRCCLRDDGLMRLRSRLSKDSWGGEGRFSLTADSKANAQGCSKDTLAGGSRSEHCLWRPGRVYHLETA